MTKSAALLFCVAAAVDLLKPIAAGAQYSPASDELAVVGLENTFLQSRVDGDTSKIRASFAGDGTFIYENGDERTRAALESDVASSSNWLAVDRSQGTTQLYRDAAITHAVLSIKLGGGEIERVRTTGVYARRAGNWRIVSWQSTPLTEIGAPQ